MDYHSSIIKIGNISLGGGNPVRIQSMTTTNTMDTAATVSQVKQLAIAGCDFVRITTRNIKEAENLKNIKNELRKEGVEVPLIADVHFNPKVAESVAPNVEKVRINPGNYIDLQQDTSSKGNEDDYVINALSESLLPLITVCKQYDTAIRIGVNHGSLSNRILVKYGNTALGMVESIMEFVRVCSIHGFEKLVLSLKSSSVVTMIEANMLLVDRLSKARFNYAIHLGITEAGNGEEARVKSSAGIGYLLAYGIGDTIRVSLAEDPLEEIPVAIKLVEFYGLRKDITGSIKTELNYFHRSRFSVKPPVVLTSEYSEFSDLSVDKRPVVEQHKSGEEFYSIRKFSYPGLSYEDLMIKATIDVSIVMNKSNPDGIWIDNLKNTSSDQIAQLTFNILQVLDLRITKTEYIACPTCGRSTINVIKQLDTLKEKTSNIPGLKIAVMGCSVNGPGEMVGANYGCVGAGKGMVHIYKDGNIAQRNTPEELAVDSIIKLIEESNDHSNS